MIIMDRDFAILNTFWGGTSKKPPCTNTHNKNTWNLKMQHSNLSRRLGCIAIKIQDFQSIKFQSKGCSAHH